MVAKQLLMRLANHVGDATTNLLVSSLNPLELITGSTGDDTVSFQLASGPMRLDLALAGAQCSSGSAWDRLISIETLIGCFCPIILSGNHNANVIEIGNGPGNDWLAGCCGGVRFVHGRNPPALDCCRWLDGVSAPTANDFII